MTKQEFDIFCRDNNKTLICYHEVSGKYLFVNNAVKDILGYCPDELIGKNPYNFFHPHDKEYINKITQTPSLKGETTNNIDYRFCKKDGNYIWLRTETIPVKNKNGIVTNLLTISIDVSNYIFLKDELNRQKLLFDEAGNMAQMGAWELDLKTMGITWSKETFDIYELEYSYIPSTDVISDKFFPEEAKTSLQIAVDNAKKHGIPYDLTLPFITAKGKKLWVRAIGKPVIEFGEIIKLYGTLQNISDEVESRNKLESMITQLTRRKKQLKTFNEILSHNIRTPITNLHSILNTYENTTDEEEKEMLFNDFKFITGSLKELLDQLVDKVKIFQYGYNELENIHISDIVNHTKSILSENIKYIDIEIVCDVTEWTTIYYSKIYLESILLNLFTNAIKYSHPDKKLIINIKTIIQDGVQVLIFSDNGLGIDLEKYRPNIFQLHQTFHKSRPGKGLGLFMIKNQIEAMGGEIAISSEVNKGTNFKIIFNKPRGQMDIAKSNYEFNSVNAFSLSTNN